MSYQEPPAPVFLSTSTGPSSTASTSTSSPGWHCPRLDIDLSVWRIYRRIGMSSGLFVSALLREIGRTLSGADIAMLQEGSPDEASLCRSSAEIKPRWILQ
jgi:hypothetical protein